jgi:hypothetical protein
MPTFQMELNYYPHFYLAEDGRLCSADMHCPGFPRVLYNTLICHGYDGDAPVYHCRLSRVHDMDRCEVSVMIPFDPAHPWLGSIVGYELDTGIGDDGARCHHLSVRGPPHSYSGTAYHASPNSESGEPRMAGAP